MAFTLTDLTTDIKADLRDDTNLVWSTAQLNRAVAHTLSEYTAARPREATATCTVTGRTIDLSANAPTGLGAATYATLVKVVAAEYPVGEYPPQYVRFDVFGSTLALDTETALAAASVKLYHLLAHTLDAGSGTIPDTDRTLLARGAAGHALRQRAAAIAADGLALGGPAASSNLTALADERLAAFRDALRATTAPGTRRLFRPSEYIAASDVVSFPD